MNHLPEPADALAQDTEYTERHPEWGLTRKLRIDGVLFEYDPYLNAWSNGLGVALSGWTIMHGMSTTLRVEVAA